MTQNKTSKEVWIYNTILTLIGVGILVTLFVLGVYVHESFYAVMLIFTVVYIVFVKPKPLPKKQISGKVTE